MALFKWDDKYSVGVSEMDTHHKKLMDILNNLSDAMAQGKGKDVLATVLKELKNYTQMHFSAEEAAMKRINYSGLAEQLEQHKKFIDELSKHEKNNAEGKALTVEVMNFLRDWLLNHIGKIDKKYGSDMNQNGIR